MRKRLPKPLKALLFLAMVVVLCLIIGNVVRFLWNGILSDVTGLRNISFWEALGLFVLGRLLFGGFRFGGHKRHRPSPAAKVAGKEKWMNMSPSEKEAFKKKWKDRCKDNKQK